MKLVCLNIWGGKAHESLMDFIKSISDDTDIFCFQEIFESNSGIVISRETRVNILADFKVALPEFSALFAPAGDGYDNAGPVDFSVTEGQATFIKNGVGVEVGSNGGIFVRGTKRRLKSGDKIHDAPVNFQYIRFSAGKKNFILCNVHGIPSPADKKDTPERIRQSQIIEDFLAGENSAKIVCGDFNLLPDTKSIKMLEENMTNLIKKFNIERTRSRLTEWWGKKGFQKFADYVFVSSEVNVGKFYVPDIDVSDHLPLVLEFS